MKLTKLSLAKTLLEAALERSGVIRNCPIEYNRDTKKWFFWDETSTMASKEYDNIDGVLTALLKYCKALEKGNTP